MGVVTVFLDKMSHLADADGFGKSDPYVKFELEQDNMIFDKGYGKKCSSKKKNDLNPEYGETFTFEGVPTLNNMVLHVRVMDDDIGLDDQIGSCDINLERLNPDAGGSTVEKVVDAKKGSWFSKKAKIYLKISYEE